MTGCACSPCASGAPYSWKTYLNCEIEGDAGFFSSAFDFTRSIFINVVFTPETPLTSTSLLDFQDVTFTDCSFENVTFYASKIWMNNVNFERSTLTNVSFIAAEIGASEGGIVFTGGSFANAYLEDVSWDLQDSVNSSPQLVNQGNGISFSSTSFEQSHFVNVRMSVHWSHTRNIADPQITFIAAVAFKSVSFIDIVIESLDILVANETTWYNGEGASYGVLFDEGSSTTSFKRSNISNFNIAVGGVIEGREMAKGIIFISSDFENSRIDNSHWIVASSAVINSTDTVRATEREGMANGAYGVDMYACNFQNLVFESSEIAMHGQIESKTAAVGVVKFLVHATFLYSVIKLVKSLLTQNS